MHDPITDMFNRIRNAQLVKHQQVEIPYSALKYSLAEILLREGFIKKVEKKKNKKGQKVIQIYLGYFQDGTPFISGLKRISKPGCRIYKKHKELKKVKRGYGVAIISTSEGLMTTQQAKKKKLGGEVLGEVW